MTGISAHDPRLRRADGRGRSEPDGAGERRAGRGVIGVLGAGTMGAGIAQLACRSGAQTLLYDPIAEALEKGRERALDGLRREAAQRPPDRRAGAGGGRAAGDRRRARGARATASSSSRRCPSAWSSSTRSTARLSEIVSRGLRAGDATPPRCPSPRSPRRASAPRARRRHALLQPGARDGAARGDRRRALGRAGARARPGHRRGDGQDRDRRAADGPGFLVNRCNRPVRPGGAAHCSPSGSPTIETIDRICRMEGGFRMGPFELMDLVGVDTGLEVSQSFYELSFGEPRWRPSPISARYVAGGHARAQERPRLLRLQRPGRGRPLPRGGPAAARAASRAPPRACS